jgi:hypothetical protein
MFGLQCVPLVLVNGNSAIDKLLAMGIPICFRLAFLVEWDKTQIEPEVRVTSSSF